MVVLSDANAMSFWGDVGLLVARQDERTGHAVVSLRELATTSRQ